MSTVRFCKARYDVKETAAEVVEAMDEATGLIQLTDKYSGKPIFLHASYVEAVHDD